MGASGLCFSILAVIFVTWVMFSSPFTTFYFSLLPALKPVDFSAEDLDFPFYLFGVSSLS